MNHKYSVLCVYTTNNNATDHLLTSNGILIASCLSWGANYDVMLYIYTQFYIGHMEDLG